MRQFITNYVLCNSYFVTKSTKSTKGTSKNKRLLYTAVLENPFKNRVLLVPLVPVSNNRPTDPYI